MVDEEAEDVIESFPYVFLKLSSLMMCYLLVGIIVAYFSHMCVLL